MSAVRRGAPIWHLHWLSGTPLRIKGLEGRRCHTFTAFLSASSITSPILARQAGLRLPGRSSQKPRLQLAGEAGNSSTLGVSLVYKTKELGQMPKKPKNSHLYIKTLIIHIWKFIENCTMINVNDKMILKKIILFNSLQCWWSSWTCGTASRPRHRALPVFQKPPHRLYSSPRITTVLPYKSIGKFLLFFFFV